MNKKVGYTLGLLRLVLGWVFLWAFLDKVFGLGFATQSGKSWMDGVSPTAGFLKFAATGPLSDFYHTLAGNALVDWLFMLGLLAVGLTLITGIKVRIGSTIAIIMMVLMYSALLFPENNPFIDEHIVYILVMLLFIFTDAGQWLGLGKWWSKHPLVQKHSWLK